MIKLQKLIIITITYLIRLNADLDLFIELLVVSGATFDFYLFDDLYFYFLYG